MQEYIILAIAVICVLLGVIVIWLFAKVSRQTILIESMIQQERSFKGEVSTLLKENRMETHNQLSTFQLMVSKSVHENQLLQADKFDRLIHSMNQSMEVMASSNEKKLEEMRVVVDEKLQQSVTSRFNESFASISDRLDRVQQGLGEMQNLATGVGDLKKVLTNVKSRGILGELQLMSILEQVLAPSQYILNAPVIPNGSQRVEVAILLPGQKDIPVLLPIDSKFPVEDYQRFLDALEQQEDVAAAKKRFESVVKKCAQDISLKYIQPPHTTDFAIMFVPVEGIYAQIIQSPELFDVLLNKYKISVVGPSNLVAFLSSLQMGFRTLAIEKRTSEVWELLATIKTEFTKFKLIIEKTQKKLQEASSVMDDASKRTRVISRKLNQVQLLDHQVESFDAEEVLYED